MYKVLFVTSGARGALHPPRTLAPRPAAPPESPKLRGDVAQPSNSATRRPRPSLCQLRAARNSLFPTSAAGAEEGPSRRFPDDGRSSIITSSAEQRGARSRRRKKRRWCCCCYLCILHYFIITNYLLFIIIIIIIIYYYIISNNNDDDISNNTYCQKKQLCSNNNNNIIINRYNDLHHAIIHYLLLYYDDVNNVGIILQQQNCCQGGVRTTAIHAVATVLSVLPDFVTSPMFCQDAKLGRNQAYASAGPFVECRVERGCW